MPIFEYKCPACGKITEKLVKSASAKPPVCDACGHKKTEKLLSSFAPQVKHSPAPAQPACRDCSNAGCPHSGM